MNYIYLNKIIGCLSIKFLVDWRSTASYGKCINWIYLGCIEGLKYETVFHIILELV